MIKEESFTKSILCKPQNITMIDILNEIKNRYINDYINDLLVIRVKRIENVNKGYVLDNGVRFNVKFICDVYSINIDDIVEVKVISSSGMGTYAYDEMIGKERALFYIPDLIGITIDSLIDIKIKGRSMYRGLTFLGELHS